MNASGEPTATSRLIVGKLTWIGDQGDEVEDADRYGWDRQQFHVGGNGCDDPEVKVGKVSKKKSRQHVVAKVTKGALNTDLEGYGKLEWADHERRNALYIENMENFSGVGVFDVPYPPSAL